VSAPHARPRDEPGSFEVQGDVATLVFRRRLRHPPEVVWRALTDPAEVAQWQLTTARVEGRAGGHVEMTHEPTHVRATGRVLAWDPPHLFEHEWNVPAGGSWPVAEHAVIRWELVPEAGGTLLTLTHRGLTSRTARVFRHGLVGLLDRLEAQLDGRPLPDWEARVRELRGSGTAPG